MEVIHSMNEVTMPLIKHKLASGELGSVTCIIADGILAGFSTDIANEHRIPIIISVRSVLVVSGRIFVYLMPVKPGKFLLTKVRTNSSYFDNF